MERRIGSKNRQDISLPNGVQGAPGLILKDPKLAIQAAEGISALYARVYQEANVPTYQANALIADINNDLARIVYTLGNGATPQEKQLAKQRGCDILRTASELHRQRLQHEEKVIFLKDSANNSD